MIYLVGSMAYDFGRQPSDYDFLCTEEEYETKFKPLVKIVMEEKTRLGKYAYIRGNTRPFEFEFTNRNPSSKMLYDYLSSLPMASFEEVVIPNINLKIAAVPPFVILMMKMSHRYLKNSPHFLKTMRDIQRMKSNSAIVLPEYATSWLRVREKETYDYDHPSLNQAKDDFFADDFYVYDHDTIHLAVALNPMSPAYLTIKEDAADVFCSKKKFLEQSSFVQLATVYEETAVLSLERYMLPNDMKPKPRKGFEIALSKVCTSISSGWWREFAYDNYDRIMAFYSLIGEDTYVKQFNKAKEQGNVLKPWMKQKDNQSEDGYTSQSGFDSLIIKMPNIVLRNQETV